MRSEFSLRTTSVYLFGEGTIRLVLYFSDLF